MRKTEFANDEYYHIYNRGVDKREVFLCEKDYLRFLICLREFNSKELTVSLRDKQKLQKRSFGLARSFASGVSRERLVDIVCYCLNPNHYHFILKQVRDRGIEKFMQRLGTSYTKYFNIKYNRTGILFQGPFKSIHIDSNEYLLYLSAYVNANNFIHGYNKNFSWPYSSLPDCIGKRDGNLCQKEIILEQFDNDFSQYEKYLRDNARYLKEKKEMEKYILE